ncbi:PEP-CTERM-box response regulator transcription factor [Sphingomonas sp.]|jgi:two-component system NtrC family response regulator|uniref:PEP-CTERM-box response regulator transcription factor n=1 Tax=Sphingomonas sp. TaxID=28214 RepID=UPI002D7FE230|nr:PEP-CTERM-box response regulator transcription factor [Sphingomonas sp.]HEU0045952.1 PEP-CTERM-box response regulator transcription factor [Sphingomonas sp.]
MSKPVLLVVEDDPGLQRQLRWAYDGYEVVVAGDRAEALEAVREYAPAVVTLDLGLPPDPDGTAEGFATLAAIQAIRPDAKIIVASGHGERASALQAIADGAWDFYAKPIDIDQLGLIVARAFHVHALEAENRRLAARVAPGGFGGMVYASPEMAGVIRTLERVSPADVSVMLLGASGTGKELLARGVHDASRRRAGPFVAINCAAIPEPLLESELFGHERGAFTGAVKTVVGKVEQAAGGTLFLDEIGDVPAALQVKLLRFLQERVIERVGGRKAIPVDTRVVCATHQDVDAMVSDGRFREDLYYRLAEIVVRIPALAERTGDAALLAQHFVARYAASLNPQVTGLAPDARAAVDGWRWPGNVRELENRIKRAVIMAEGKRVTAADLDLGTADGGEPIELRTVREVADRKAIARALSRADGNISGASRLLGVSRPTLYDLLKSYDLHA